jgi:hypothetical protein
MPDDNMRRREPVLRPYESSFWDRLATRVQGDGKRLSPEARRVMNGLLGTTGLGAPDDQFISLRELVVPESAAEVLAMGALGKVGSRAARKAMGAGAGTLFVMDPDETAKSDPVLPPLRSAFGDLHDAKASLDRPHLGYAGGGLAKRALDKLGFFSRAAEEAGNLKQSKGTPEQIRSMLLKSGVKPDELKWTGFDDWAKGKQSITKDEAVQFLNENRVQLGETKLGGANPYPYTTSSEWQRAINRAERQGNYDEAERLTLAWEAREGLGGAGAAKFEQYTLPGGDNYREVLLTRPEREAGYYSDFESWFKDNFKGHAPAAEASVRQFARHQWDDAGGKIPNYKNDGNYTSSHWDEPNVLAHLRMKDRVDPEGRRVLHLEELQSDWAQEGRKRGFKDTSQDWIKTHDDYRDRMVGDWVEMKAAKAMQENAELFGDVDRAREAARMSARHYGARRIADDMGVADEYGRLYDSMAKAQEGLPNAPYVDSTQKWTDLALKRALKEAADGNYDALAWTPGAEQAKRYDLSRHIDEIGYIPNSDGTYQFSAIAKDGRTLPVPNSQAMTLEQIESAVGKEMAEKIRSGEGAVNQNGSRSLSGLDLRVGGEGMIGYYDKIVPTQLQKLAKTLDPDAPFGTLDISNAPRRSTAGPDVDNLYRELAGENPPAMVGGGEWRVPSLTITPAMREKTKQGLPLFTMTPAAALPALQSAYDEQAPEAFAKGGPVDRLHYYERIPLGQWRDTTEQQVRDYIDTELLAPQRPRPRLKRPNYGIDPILEGREEMFREMRGYEDGGEVDDDEREEASSDDGDITPDALKALIERVLAHAAQEQPDDPAS